MCDESTDNNSNNRDFRDSDSGLREQDDHEAAFNDLIEECKHNPPGARLSARLRKILERIRPEHRRDICSRTRDGCAPLFVACRRGNAEMVEYLVYVCNAELEQRGVYEVPHDRSTHSVTPLWCAAVAGRMQILRILADAGADINAGSDSGSTPVRSACFMTHLDVVKFLVERGADIHRPNYNGGTCLINSVQSVPLCSYLLQRGARVDARDMQLKTALHYAIQEHRLETVRLLLQRGASPHLRSRAGDDALRTACVKGATQVVSLLLSRVRYTPSRVADAYELLGATQLDEFNDADAALASWRRATAIRHAHGAHLPKRAADDAGLAAVAEGALGGAAEWRSSEQLEALALDIDELRTQALLVAARVLGASHKDAVYRLMYRGAAYADSGRYQRCFDLWTCALQIRIRKDSLLFTETCHAASALTKLMLDVTSGRLERPAGVPRYADVLRVFRLVAENLPPSRRALQARPVHKRQADAFDRALRCASHLLYLLLATATTARDFQELSEHVRRLVRADVRSARTGDTLLHLCVSRLNVMRSTYFAELIEVPFFRQPVLPCVAVAGLLLRCGADPRARNESRSTALHVAAVPYNFSTELVEELLAGGAHLDQPNRFGESAAEMVLQNRGSRVCVLRHVSLACLAARALLAAGVRAGPGAAPPALLAFVELHRA
ncbi:protein fem-1 homolog A isoform X3 [Vanessa cardui]|uniref:protein fem-1 homolog A isoform X3 n=1 Tax=Vanessa cardui TaxID=171605 RepID=UPI001F146F36|nr:protein fem-1 homolog A isoform X3 [Vanessa cardui]